MSDLTLKSIEQLLDVKLDEKLDQKLKPIQKTLDGHTTALAALATDMKTVLTKRRFPWNGSNALNVVPSEPEKNSASSWSFEH